MNKSYLNSLKTNFISKYTFLAFFIGFLLSISLESHAGKRKIKIKRTDSLVFSESMGKNVRRLYGNVQFEHQGGLMFCDSAYFYAKDNSFDAFSNVRIKQSDSVNLYGDTLYFDGNTQIAKMRGKKVTLIDGGTTLTTRFLDYNMKTNTGYYYNGGHIISEDNVLDSEVGRYFEKQNEFFFKDSVVLVNPSYTITSDTLRYNTRTEIAYFFGPTDIVSDENFIYCENGWYDTRKDLSQFKKNAYLNNGDKFLYGDSLTYDRNTSIGEAFLNVIIKDTAQKTIIHSNYGYYKEEPELIVVTDSIRFIQVMQGDSLFMHSDSIVGHFDSTNTHRLFKVYNHVRFYKTDLQGKCDSLVYTFSDSTLKMYIDPVLWSLNYQVTGEEINVHLNEGEVDRIYVFNQSYLVSEEDSIRYNQVKGQDMIGYVEDRELYQLDVKRNGETIYFMKDERELLGVNKARCEDITVRISGMDIDEIVFIKSPEGTMFPPNYLERQELYLKDFIWLDDLRPTDKWDIFKLRGRESRQIIVK